MPPPPGIFVEIYQFCRVQAALTHNGKRTLSDFCPKSFKDSSKKIQKWSVWYFSAENSAPLLRWSFNLFQRRHWHFIPAVDNIWPAFTSNVSFMTRFGGDTRAKIDDFVQTWFFFPFLSFSPKVEQIWFSLFSMFTSCLYPHHRENKLLRNVRILQPIKFMKI